jgi:spermidine/putrescine transport system substrate-binding protein
VPNKAAMDGLDPALLAQYPNMAITPATLLGYEQLRDVGEAQRAYSRVVTEIMAAQ